MRIIYFFLILICVFTSCQQKSKEKRDVSLETQTLVKEENRDVFFDIDLEKITQEAEEDQLPLSDFIKDIDYVPLQTTSKSLIGGGLYGIQQYLVTDKMIVADMKIFSRQDGHYIGDLLKKGQGPEEYLYIMGLDADDKREEFYLYDSSRLCVHVVGYDNIYKGTISGCGDYANVYSFGNGDILIPNYNTLTDRQDAFFINNVDKKEVVYKRISPALQGITNLVDCKRVGKVKNYTGIIGDIKNTFWKYKDEIRYYDTLTDSVYTINKEYQIKPLGRLDTEKLRMTFDQWNMKASSQNFYVFSLSEIFETSNYILFYLNKYNFVSGDNLNYWIIYSKKDGSIKGYKHEKATPHPLYLNDMDQGLSLHFNFPTSAGDGACQFLSAESIKDYIAEKGDDYFTTEKGKAFKAMGDRLKYDDNEVVAIMKWK